MTATFDEHGLASLVHGKEVLMDATGQRVKVQYFRFPNENSKTGFDQDDDPKPQETSFDVATETMR